MDKIFLKLSDVIEKAREAFLNGELQANRIINNPGTGESCKYAGPCAIGVSLTAEQQVFLDNQQQTEISTLIEGGVVESDDPDGLDDIQTAHDNVCHDPTPGAIAHFREILDLPPTA